MKSSQSIADTIELLRQSKNISQTKMLKDCGLGKNAIASMKTFYPNIETLSKIADYLCCSVDYLLGRTEQLNYSSDSFILNQNEQNIINIYRLLSNANQQSALSYIQFLLVQSNTLIENISEQSIPTNTISTAARNGTSDTPPITDDDL